MGEQSWYYCWHDIGATKVSDKTDIEIARAAQKKPIFEIGESLNIPAADLVPFGHDKAKISQSFINSVQERSNGKLILVTAIKLGMERRMRLISTGSKPPVGEPLSVPLVPLNLPPPPVEKELVGVASDRS